MPFDGAGRGDLLAVQMIDLITAFFWDGACWTRGEMYDEYGKRCLVGAMRYIRAQTGISGDRTAAYIRRAMGAENHAETCLMEFNDSCHSYAEVAAVLRRAREFALADGTVVA
jgi:hypothetical protein